MHVNKRGIEKNESLPGLGLIRLIVAFSIGCCLWASCNGDRGIQHVQYVSKVPADAKVDLGSADRPVHSLGPEMRRAKAPPWKPKR
jgi:hypothetical protein